MRKQDGQVFWEPATSAIRLPGSKRLALPGSEKVRLMKGLVRFVNCGDSESDYQALGRSFPRFWPLSVAAPRTDPPAVPQKAPRTIAQLNQINREFWAIDVSLAWNRACHKIFLFYRDRLRDVWKEGADVPPRFWIPEFLLGLYRKTEETFSLAKQSLHVAPPFTDLGEAFSDMLASFPGAECGSALRAGMLWNRGDFYILPENDFQRAFYVLFRQSWRARVCSNCGTYFIANRPNQPFCGTLCSSAVARSRKRLWWGKHGEKWRKENRGEQ